GCKGKLELTIFCASDRYRTQLENTEIQWLEAQPTDGLGCKGKLELTIFCASDRYRTQLENTEIQWLEAQ
ncbi:hypothetical protein KXZ74_26005, partial [Escherichia coli]|nr:hypothetical protein [Escherichia coli]